jgi:FAD/FMN-containing dehydrogenase
MAVYGHIGDNNLHLLVAPRPWSEEARHRAEEMVYRPLVPLGGSVSAEHCIGLDKREWLPLSRNREELGLMRLLKSSLDPLALLNRGKVL